jgi:hypothetical protein
MRCTKCHKNEATIHFTPVVHGKAQKAVHFCKDCATTSTGFHFRDPKKAEALPVKGKRCSFCRRPARFGEMTTGRARYWCLGCRTELRDIFLDLCASERHPRLVEQIEGTGALIIRDDPEVPAWMVGAGLRAAKIFVDRRREHGRDKGS